MRANLLPITGIGSLPHKDIERAIKYSLKYDIPFLPELTKIENTIDISDIKNLICYSKFLDSVKDKPLFKTQSFLDIDIDVSKNHIHFIDDPKKDLTTLQKKFGLHCCNSISIEEIEGLNISHLSFDASLIKNPREFITTLLKKNITPVVGIISTHNYKYSICHNFQEWKPLLKEFVMSCWISPACGLSSFTEADADNIYDLLREVQREITLSIT